MSVWSHWKRAELSLRNISLPTFDNGHRFPGRCAGCKEWKRSLFINGTWYYCRACAYALDDKAGYALSNN